MRSTIESLIGLLYFTNSSLLHLPTLDPVLSYQSRDHQKVTTSDRWLFR